MSAKKKKKKKKVKNKIKINPKSVEQWNRRKKEKKKNACWWGRKILSKTNLLIFTSVFSLI